MIVIPMAGLSSRFFKAGFDKPKYMLEAHGKTLFEHSVASFEHYFQTQPFMFIVRDIFDTPAFVEQQCQQMGIANYQVIVLEQETRGQAETVYLALQKAGTREGAITIFNIDTFRPGFRFPDPELIGDGFLDVFEGSGDNWSFARPAGDGSRRVLETAEKQPISNLCSTGLYHFSDVRDFLLSYEDYLNKPSDQWAKGELYVAPLYNHLIELGRSIFYNLIPSEGVIFCGTPDEYRDFQHSFTSK